MVVVPARMRELNRRALLTRLRQMGRASRATLAKSLGLSPPTTGKIVDELLRAGILEEVEAPVPARRPKALNGRLGRPARLVQLDRARPRFLGIELDVHQTRLACLPIGVDGTDDWMITLPTGEGAQAWERQLREGRKQLGPQAFWGVLVSVPGIVDEAAGRVLMSPNLHWTERVGLPGLIRRVWEAEVALVQEERALALGHQLIEGGQEDFLLVDFGEGVGSAIVLGGQLYRGPLPLSGELGHTPVPGNQRRCGCGGVGCVETLVCREGLLASFRAAQQRGPAGLGALSAHLVEEGMPQWLMAALDAVGAVIAGAVNVLGVRRVILTGTLTELPPMVTAHLSDAVIRGAMWGRFGKVVCQTAPRRRAAGLVMAAVDRLVLREDRKPPP